MGWRVSLIIHYDRRSGLAALIALTLLTAALLVTLVWGRGEAVASNPQAPLAAYASMRQYYLTGSAVPATQVLTACAFGYHTASLWEILDTSQLKYNTTLGDARDDSGQGPPSFLGGWVRTGYNGDTSNTPGQANCNNWTSTSGGDYGTYAQLPRDWAIGGEDVHIWEVGTTLCSTSARVWCVEDYLIYLPVILRNYSL